MFDDLASSMTTEQRDDLVARLLPCLDSHEWESAIADLPAEIKFKFDDSPVLHTKITNLLRRCLKINQGVEILLSRVRLSAKGTLAWDAAAQRAFEILTRLPDAQAGHAGALVRIVEQIDPLAETLRRIYKQLSIDLDPAPSNGFLALLRIGQLPEKTMVLQFARRLADASEASKRAVVQQWLKEAAALFPTNGEEAGADPIPPDILRNTLLIQLQPVSQELFEISSWLDLGAGLEIFTGALTPLKLAEAVEEIGMLASAAINAGGSDVEIELIVTRGLFAHDINSWQVMKGELNRALIQEAPLVFRCLERIEARRTEMASGTTGMSAVQAALAKLRAQKGKGLVNLTGWRKKWEAVARKGDLELEALIETVVCAGQDLGALIEELDPQDKGLCIGLGYVPFAETGSPDEFSAVLSTGVPVVIWFREIPTGIKIDVASLKKIFGGSKVKLADVRRFLWELRREAVRKGTPEDICRNISLLYDDYERIPPPPAAQTPVLTPKG